MSKIGKIAGAAALAVVMGAAASAQAQEGFRPKQAGDLAIGLGGIGVLPANDGGRVDTIGGRPRASSSGTAQIDFTYFLTPNFSLNLIVATTQHDLTARGTAAGNLALGSIWALPPTLTAQYHPLPDQQFSPYVGLGLNYTAFYGYDNSGAAGVVRSVAVNNSVGLALNAGLDIAITGPWGLNLDIKKIWMSPHAAVGTTLPGVKIHAKTEINPLVIGASVRYRFSL